MTAIQRIMRNGLGLALLWAAGPGGVFAAAQPENNTPTDPCDEGCVVLQWPTGSMSFTDVTFTTGGTNICFGTLISASPAFNQPASERIYRTISLNGTQCQTNFHTNSAAPYFTTNWWTITGTNGFSAVGNSSHISDHLLPHCGTYSLTFYGTWRHQNPCTDELYGGGTISISRQITVARLEFTETTKLLCAGESTSFTLTNSCNDVTWEVYPDLPGGPTFNGSMITAGTNCGPFAIVARSTVNTNCEAYKTLYVLSAYTVAPEGISPMEGSSPPVYVVCKTATDSANRWLRVAAYCPSIDLPVLPSCWDLSSAAPFEVKTNNLNEVWTNKLAVIVDTSQAQTNTIIATAGSTIWTNIIIVQNVTLGIANTNVFVNSDDDNTNGVPDVDEPLTGSGSAVAGENDLVNISLQVQNTYTNATVTLSATFAGYGGGRIRVWPTAQRGPGTPLIDTGDWATSSTNWPGDAMPTNLWVEGVGPSASVGDVGLMLSTPFGCSASTNLTVIDVVSVSWQTNSSPLLSNTTLGGPGGGLAIFPCKPTPASSGDFSLVNVVVSIQPAMGGIPLYLKSFDVDDPSSGHQPPLDDETAPQDNKAADHKAGRLGGDGDTITLLTATNGVAWTNFNVTMQPGDNFRVVGSPVPDFRNHCYAIQTNTHGALGYLTSTNEIPSRYMADMLTVWRRLHVEVDSMSAVTNNFVSDHVTGILGSGTTATHLILGINLRTGLTPVDNSRNLSLSPVGNGRFENGTIEIGTEAGQGVEGNGDTFLRNAGGFSIPAQVIHGGAPNAVGNVRALSGSVFTITGNLGTNSYAGGSFVAAGTSFTISTNTATTVTVSGTAQIPFVLRDDDDDGILPTSPDLGDMERAYGMAYTLPINNGGGNPSNNSIAVPFLLNSASDNTAALRAEFQVANALQSDGNRAPDFWVAYILAGYQGVPAGARADNDPVSEAGLGGVTDSLNGIGSYIYLESIRDESVEFGWGANTQTVIQRTVVHEIAHQFGLPDRPPGGGLMSADIYNFATPINFIPEDLHAIRSRTNSPGR